MFEGAGVAVMDRPAPAAEMVARLDALDPGDASQASLIGALAELQRLTGWVASVQARVLAGLHAQALVAAADPDDREWLSEEVGAVLRLPAGFARGRMEEAAQLVHRLPTTLGLLAAGVVTPRQATLLAEAVLGLDDEACARVETRVLVRAADQSSAQFGRSLARAVMAAAPKTAEQAHVEAVAQRRVDVRPVGNGMALLFAVLPAPEAMRLKTAIWALGATRAHRDNPDRGDCLEGPDPELADQRRADALVELGDRYLAYVAELASNGGATSGPVVQAPAVRVTVSLKTLLGDSDEPGELAGYGPIPASLARQIAFDEAGTWQRLLTDPAGQLINLGTTRYRPPKHLADHVKARDQTCAFPHCNRQAEVCELDHIQPWSHGGHTNANNLIPLCARHHHLKHDTNWTIERDNTTGQVEWTSPTGRTYRNPPPDSVSSG